MKSSFVELVVYHPIDERRLDELTCLNFRWISCLFLLIPDIVKFLNERKLKLSQIKAGAIAKENNEINIFHHAVDHFELWFFTNTDRVTRRIFRA